jgi:hypothetical protein
LAAEQAEAEVAAVILAKRVAPPVAVVVAEPRVKLVALALAAK